MGPSPLFGRCCRPITSLHLDKTVAFYYNNFVNSVSYKCYSGILLFDSLLINAAMVRRIMEANNNHGTDGHRNKRESSKLYPAAD